MDSLPSVTAFNGMLFDPFGGERPPREYLQPYEAINNLSTVERYEAEGTPEALLLAGDICLEAANFAQDLRDRERLLTRAWLDWEGGLLKHDPEGPVRPQTISTVVRLANLAIYRSVLVEKRPPFRRDSIKAYQRLVKLGEIVAASFYDQPNLRAEINTDTNQLQNVTARLSTMLLLKRMALAGQKHGEVISAFKSENESIRARDEAGWNLSYFQSTSSGGPRVTHKVRVRINPEPLPPAQARRYKAAGIAVVNPEVDLFMQGTGKESSQAIAILEECVNDKDRDLQSIVNLQRRAAMLAHILAETKR